MQYLPIILTVALVHWLAAMSPGPDFIMVMRNSLGYGRRSGMYSALGLSLGIVVHITYCLLGIAWIISRSILLFSTLKYLGAAYLIWIGYKALRAPAQSDPDGHCEAKPPMTRMQAVRSGFLTNVTNPKATLFFLSLFTLVIHPTTPLWVKLIMAAEMSIAQFVWFSLVGVIASHNIFRKQVIKFQHYIERVMGGILILLGVKLASERLK